MARLVRIEVNGMGVNGGRDILEPLFAAHDDIQMLSYSEDARGEWNFEIVADETVLGEICEHLRPNSLKEGKDAVFSVNAHWSKLNF